MKVRNKLSRETCLDGMEEEFYISIFDKKRNSQDMSKVKDGLSFQSPLLSNEDFTGGIISATTKS